MPGYGLSEIGGESNPGGELVPNGDADEPRPGPVISGGDVSAGSFDGTDVSLYGETLDPVVGPP
jgi:hypothetical protein